MISSTISFDAIRIVNRELNLVSNFPRVPPPVRYTKTPRIEFTRSWRHIHRAEAPRAVYLYLQTPVSSRSLVWAARHIAFKAASRVIRIPAPPVWSAGNARVGATLNAAPDTRGRHSSSATLRPDAIARSRIKAKRMKRALSYRRGPAANNSPPRSARPSPRGYFPTRSSPPPSSARTIRMLRAVRANGHGRT